MDVVKTSYKSEDVTFLLKDLTGRIAEVSVAEMTNNINKGRHYCTMLNEEEDFGDEYMTFYYKSLEIHAYEIAKCIQELGNRIADYTISRTATYPVIISLARAGTPVGILIKRYLQSIGIKSVHYSISIIRDKGIDVNALEYIYKHETAPVDHYFFVDGWTGKGSIQTELQHSVNELKNADKKWKDLSSDLYVVSDPANITFMRGTSSDVLLPTALLNSTVSGLVSRTVLNDLIHSHDFHGAVYYADKESRDVSNHFIDRITAEFDKLPKTYGYSTTSDSFRSAELIAELQKKYHKDSATKIKPSIGECTRSLIRRVPEKVLLDCSDIDPDIQHIIWLCNQKNVPMEMTPLGNYKACSIIK